MICRKCDQPFPPHAKGGRVCRKCLNKRTVERRRERFAADPALHAEAKRIDSANKKARYQTDPDYRERVKRHNRTRFKRHGRKHHLRQYGITPEAWEVLFDGQGRRCAICRRQSPGASGWCTDHCHRTGVVRGILCHACNRGIGNLGDDPDRLRAAAEYVEKHQHDGHAQPPRTVTTPVPISVSSTS